MNDEAIPTENGEEVRTDFDVFPAVRVINLERSATRWTSIHHSLVSGGIKNFARIDAVDALHLSQDGIGRAYDTDMNRKYYFSPLMPGEVACFLSHRKAWRQMIEENLNGAFILEDDVVLLPGAALSMREIANHAKSSEPLVVKIFCKRRVSGKVTQISRKTQLVEPLLPPLGTQGAYVNRAAAEKLLTCSDEFYEPVDVFLQKTWTHRVKIQVLVPNAIDEVSDQLGGTTLSSSRKKTSSRIRREMHRPIFRLWMYLRALWEKAVRN